MRQVVTPMLILVTVPVCSVTMDAHNQRRPFEFVEESWRLPADTSLPGTSSTDVDLVDVDGDGDLDLFVAEGTDTPAPRPNRLLLNDGGGVFFDVSLTHLPPRVDNSTKVDFADLDGDRDLDLVVANSRNEPVALYTNKRGVFTARDFGAIPGVNETNTGLELVDLDDDDGDLDLVVGNSGENGGERVFVQHAKRRHKDER